MAMRNRPHPRGIVRRECLEPLGLSIRGAVKRLDVAWQSLAEFINERSGVSADMAIRFSKSFGWPPETWLGTQVAYDGSQVGSRIGDLKVEMIGPA